VAYGRGSEGRGQAQRELGKAYTAMLVLQPGDVFEIKLSKKKGVTLLPVASDEEVEED